VRSDTGRAGFPCVRYPTLRAPDWLTAPMRGVQDRTEIISRTIQVHDRPSNS
jgi:hypothetical protein